MRYRVSSITRCIVVSGLLAVIALASTSTPTGGAQGFVPFACDGTVYYALNNVKPGKTQLTTYSEQSSSFSIIGSPAPRHNSLAFNPIDGFMYAMVPNTTEIFKIGANGNIISLWLPLGDNPYGTQWVSGTFLPTGEYVVLRNPLDADGGYVMVIDGITHNRPEVVRGQPIDIDTTDLAYNPNDGLLYAFDRKANINRWMTIDPQTLEYAHFGGSSEMGSATGGIAFNADGILLTVGHGQDEHAGRYAIYSIDLNPTSPSYGAFNLFDVSNEPSSGSDAASCYY